MNANELSIAANLLENASEQYSNHGCNDLSLTNTDANWAIVCEMNDWAKIQPQDRQPRPAFPKPIITYDWLMMSYLAQKMEKESGIF